MVRLIDCFENNIYNLALDALSSDLRIQTLERKVEQKFCNFSPQLPFFPNLFWNINTHLDYKDLPTP